MSVFFLAFLLAPALGAADEPTRGERLAALRAEVEELQHTVKLEKTALDGRLAALEQARTDVELQLKAEDLALQQLAAELEREVRRSQESGAAHQDLVPMVQKALVALEPLVRAGIPYRVPERLAAISELQAGIQGGTIPSHKATARLWSLYEDELRLGRENALDRQVIGLGGREVLADVARLGMVALYWRTADGRVGWAAPGESDWAWVEAQSATQRAQVTELFEALGKQIRVGAFSLPNPNGRSQ